MKKSQTSLLTLAVLMTAALCMLSCSKKKFTVTGIITEAADSVLYFENMALDGPQLVDSLVLDADGAFIFTGEAPTDAPEFYRLRIAQQIVSLSIDSTETVSIHASYPTMAAQYTVEGSENCSKIKELSTLQMNLQAQAQNILDAPDLSAKNVEDSILRVVERYKQFVANNYIYKEPMKAYAYYALFQGIVVGDGYMMIFSPRRDVKDVKPYSAVATSWDALYPNSLRGANLHNIAIEGMRTKKIIDAESEGLTIDASKVSQANLIDIVLNDNKGVTRRLTDLEGKVVLLDFHIFAAEGSTARILALRELYNKYHDRGLEIYQVSLDEDEHFWKTQTAALPWISVRETSSKSSPYLYEVQGLPVDYIISRDNQVVLGPRQIKDLDSDIARYL